MEKVISDNIVTTKETIFLLQQWLTCLEQRQGEVVEFELMCQQLREVGLGGWLERAGGYELKTLRHAIADPRSVEAIELAEWE